MRPAPSYNLSVPFVKQTFLLEGRVLCAFPRPFSWEPSGPDTGWKVVLPYAYVCPKCLSTWAIAPLTNGLDQDFEILPSACPRHGAGSLILSYGDRIHDPALIDFGPEPLLTREFSIALSLAEISLI